MLQERVGELGEVMVQVRERLRCKDQRFFGGLCTLVCVAGLLQWKTHIMSSRWKASGGERRFQICWIRKSHDHHVRTEIEREH